MKAIFLLFSKLMLVGYEMVTARLITCGYQSWISQWSPLCISFQTEIGWKQFEIDMPVSWAETPNKRDQTCLLTQNKKQIQCKQSMQKR